MKLSCRAYDPPTLWCAECTRGNPEDCLDPKEFPAMSDKPVEEQTAKLQKGIGQRVAEVFATVVFVCIGLIILILLGKVLFWAILL